ncbi:helicase-exonuclease AddAB subunit AddB [Neomoorella mulderi]|uniref:ATP-dependent helicase/deoxyribonuclease subunit B n=1 Tax=Moorella mulderi DSM 14980 TaxID=1122241 RepID=A0A151ATK7_9FIRM|nr:helicase-exonuclease AddAB subunit AddB [Moorella mulderi]KYH30951.1 ATP-dependent helicase/deoxyribonuclease subunit B [Moorella mulderi DSM 14980]
MALRLVLGRAGSGKTRLCLEEIKAALAEGPAGPALIILTPEQATLQMELDLHRALPCPGFSRAQVLSFRRLGWRVFQEAGGAARPHLGEMGKRMALRAIVNARQGDLTLFASLAGSPGFIEQLAHTIAELKLYRVEPGDLRRVAEHYRETGRGETILGRKLHDLALIYNDLETYLAGRYLDPDDYLALLARRLPEASFVKGACVWVDGFNGFTPQEEAVLQALMAAAARVTVTLCLDPKQRKQQLGETELFHPTSETYHRLQRLARAAGINIEADVLLTGTPPRFQAAPALAHLEAHFGRWPLKPFKGSPDGIRLVAAASRRLEVEAAAREILRLAREENLRFREMAVLVRDLEPYHDLIVNTFRDYNIPFFIDRRRPVGHHPLIELVRAALETVLENWAYDPVFRYLKSDLVPVSRDEVDLLENYVLAHGIRGRQWLEDRPWQFKNHRDLDDPPEAGSDATAVAAVNRARERAGRHLRRFYQAVQGRTLTVQEITAAIFDLLQELQVNRQLEAWHRQALAAGDLDAAQEHEQVWEGLMDLLDELVTALGDTPMELEEYAAILDTGMESLKLRLIPPALDQVVVGTLDRSRQPELQAALVLGVGEGVLPARLPEDATFSDREREELQVAGIELAPAGSLRLFHEEYLAYLALTRSRRFLWLSYPLADAEGRALAPSPLIRRLRQLLPGLQEENAGPDLPEGEAGLDYLTAPRQAAGHLARILSQKRSLTPLWQEVYLWLEQDRDREKWLALLGGINYRNQVEPLEAPLVDKLYPQPLRSSISRLETFAACPFRYFLAYGLKLQERQLYQVDPAGMGQFYHAALKLFVEELKRSGRDWSEVSDEEAAALLSRVVEELAPALQHEILSSSARYTYLRKKLEQTLQRVLEVLNEHARRGEFRPFMVEASFSRRGDLPPLVLEAGPGRQVILEGRVDRIDVARYQGRAYLRVIDYKSSHTGLELDRVYHGLSLQLPLYLQAALAAAPQVFGEPAEPAGILYFAVRNPTLRQRAPVREAAEVARLRRQALKMRGLLLAEPEIIKLMDKAVESTPDLLPVRLNKDGSLRRGAPAATREQMALLLALARARAAGLAGDILSGRVEISPYRLDKATGCDSCPYRPVCGFDLQVPGTAYRRLPRIDSQNFWEVAARQCSKSR